MWLRCTIVALVVLWLLYEYTLPQWTTTLSTIWSSYSTYIKFGLGGLAIVVVMLLPSLETVARNHQSVYTMLREFLVNDQYVGHFEPGVQTSPALSSSSSSSPSSPSSPSFLPTRPTQSFTQDAHARAQFRDGVKLSRGDANIPDSEQDEHRLSNGLPSSMPSATSGSPLSTHQQRFPTDAMLRRTAPDVRQKVADSQGRLCVACKTGLSGAEFVVVDRGAACMTCAKVLGG